MLLLDDKDKLKQHPDSGGYFRIGHVVLDIPPEDINTTRVSNSDEVTPLRSPYAMYVKTGQARWDATVRWTAVVKESIDGEPDYSQWEDVRNVLAIFKAAPFVEVENGHLRQVFAALDPSFQTARMAFGLRQFRIETHSDIVNALSCTLTMTLFNYHPYTKDFAYVGVKGPADKTDAYLSQDFLSYIRAWIARNLDQVWDAQDGGTPQAFQPGAPWAIQEPGLLSFHWRLYRELMFQPGSTPTTPTDDLASKQAEERKKKLQALTGGGRYDDAISSAGLQRGIDPALLKAIMEKESAFRPDALQSNLDPKKYSSSEINRITNQLRADIQTSSDGGAAAVAAHRAKYGKAPDLGLMQINYQFNGQGLRPVDLFDPNVNITRGALVVDGIFRQGLTENEIDAYNVGVSAVKQGRRNLPYVQDVLRNKAKYTTSTTVNPSSPPPPPSPTPSPDDDAAKVKDMQTKVQSLVNDKWQLDHVTDSHAFFFKEFDITLTDTTHSAAPNIYSLFPQGLVILFVNNLAQIPLGSYQYPTYQHIGPATALVSMGFLSKGDQKFDDGATEPVHPGIQELNFMSHQLDDQYQRFKVGWRSHKSVYRMQAVRVYNQVLNMLGINGLMIKDINTSTLPESSNVVAVNVTASQYENMYEEVSPYRVNGPNAAYNQQLNDYVFGDQLDAGLSDAEKRTITRLLQYREARKNHDVHFFDTYLLDPKGSVPSPKVSLPFPLPAQVESTLKSILNLDAITDNSTIGKMSPAQASAVNSGIGVYELLWLSASVQAEEGKRLVISGLIPGILPNIPDEINVAIAGQQLLLQTTPQGQAALDAFYSLYFPIAAKTDASLQQALNQVTTSPSFQKQIQGKVRMPGDDNGSHGAYRDLGLNELSLRTRDWNPGYYFVDYSKELSDAIQKGTEKAIGTGQTVNQNDRVGSTPIYNSDPLFGDEDLALRMKAPDYNMAAAFPTFKLFLIEEDNNGIFYALDDFYSYSTVLDIEIIRYRDKPHQAIIQLTNIANLLTHKLYDNTSAGRAEKKLRPFGTSLGISSDGGVGGPPGSSAVVGENLGGENYLLLGRDMTEKKKVPLQLFALQPGTKIEVRMGFSNNPDNLVRVFGGIVAEVEGDQILTIRAQGFQAELMSLPADMVQSGGLLNMLATGRMSGPKYGGPRLFGDSGDSGTVIEKMLKASTARHFGHWQLNTNTSPYLKGFTWSDVGGSLLEALSGVLPGRGGRLTGLAGAMMRANYDRTGDNILINDVVKTRGNPLDQSRGRRGLFEETSIWAHSPEYHLPQKSSLTPWDYIRDVSRRYPEYNLLVKDYGFPFGTDATMVFAHPRDSYYSRPFYYDETRSEIQVSTENNTLFRQWWESRGRGEFYNAAEISHEYAPYLFRLLGVIDVVTGNTVDAAVDNINTFGATAFYSIMDYIYNSNLDNLRGVLSRVLPGTLIVDPSKVDAMRRQFLFVLRDWQSYRDLRVPNQAFHSALQPVRKYHYVDFQSIIHNGITVNAQIFNAVRLDGNNPIKANDNIPDNYTRVLDITSQIVMPHENVVLQELETAYAQSFLKEEVGKMYRGELVLRGIPSIDPGDVILIVDPGTGMTGPIEVDSVIHSFNQENGYITIVKPRLYISINEQAGQEWLKRVASSFTNMFYVVFGAGYDEFTKSDAAGKSMLAWEVGSHVATGVAINTALTTVGLPSAVSVARTGVASLGMSASIPTAIVVTLLAVGALTYATGKNAALNKIIISPINRFGRPWIGGLEGYEIGDWWRLVHNNWDRFVSSEIAPIMESFHVLMEAYDSVS
jgi:hypothetical protein